MALMKNEAKEYKSLKKKSKQFGVPVKRVGSANISFGKGVITQLGTGKASGIMDARVKLKKKYSK